ncbi:MAG: sulfotransferase [Dokdonella sp.]
MKKAARSKPTSSKSGPRYPPVPAKAVSVLRDVEQALASNNLPAAERALALALVLAPDHPQTVRLLGRTQYRRGGWAEAASNFAAVHVAMPGDIDNLIDLGRAQSANGEHTAAAATLQRALEQRDDAATLIELGIVLDAGANAEAALEVADRLSTRDPTLAAARLLRARSLQALGRIDDTAAEYRELIRRGQETPAAWFGLMDIKTLQLDVSGHAALQAAYGDPRWNDVERSMLGYAFGRACEDAGEYPDAVEAFGTANRLARRRVIWDSARWTRQVGDIASAFDKVTESATADLGSEVIFIVGLPRSGTTLVEQILAAHPKVEGANELPDLAFVIEQESRRCRIPFPQWAAKASAADWERLGRDYLARTVRWRVDKPIHTDKMPENWPCTAAIRAMLPSARIIDSRRDPVETTWSCFKQLFGPNRVAYSYDATELAQYWRDYDGFMRAQARRHASHLRVQSHETLTADLETEVRALLEFCGLEWNAACLQSHRAARAVRTASAAQVRQPLRQSTASTAAYGEYLAPFRRQFVDRALK